jgi:hypothetical protein
MSGSTGETYTLTKLLKSLDNVILHLLPIKQPSGQRYRNYPHFFNYSTLSCPPMPSLSSPPYQTLSQRDAPPPPVELRNWSGTCLLQLDLSTYPPRVISVSDTEQRMPPEAPGLSLPLGELPVLPLVTNPLRRPQSLQNDRALQSQQTLIPADFVRRTTDAALSWEAAYGPIEAALTHRAGTTPFAPIRSLTLSPHSSSSSPLPIPYSEPTIVPPPVKRQHSMGALSTNSRRTNTRSPVPLFHPYPKKDSKAKEVHGSPRGSEGRGDLGTVTDTDGWTDADTFLSWEDQANASPPIPGFRLNQGWDFIPCQIQDAQGNIWPAKWTRLDRGDDTYIAGIRAHSPNAHSQRLRALPSHDSVPTTSPLTSISSK